LFITNARSLGIKFYAYFKVFRQDKYESIKDIHGLPVPARGLFHKKPACAGFLSTLFAEL
jgi:hypothetical protein